MTELQLRLWCLWMCEEFAGMLPVDCFYAAIEGSELEMANLLMDAVLRRSALQAWALSERMP